MLDAHVRRVSHLGGKKDTQRLIDFLAADERGEKYATESHVHAMARHLKVPLSPRLRAVRAGLARLPDAGGLGGALRIRWRIARPLLMATWTALT